MLGVINDEDNICYLGSTRNSLQTRFEQHKEDYLECKKSITSSKLLFKKYGIENCSSKLIAKYYVSNRIEQLQKERKHYDELKPLLINQVRPYVTEAERVLQKQEYKQKEKALRAEKREANPIVLIGTRARDKKEKVQCECGGHYSFDNKRLHFKTKMHLAYINNL